MPIPQLVTTNGDFSNALFKLAEGERQRQEQADISYNRNLQTQSLIENRQVENALRQIQMNKEQADMENAKLDMFHKHLTMADPTNEEDWTAFSEYEKQNSKATIPIPRKADGTFDKEAATAWRDNKLDTAVYLKTGNRDVEEINLQKENPDGTYQTMTYSKKKKDKSVFDPEKMFGKGWNIVDKFVNPQDLEEKKAAREARIAAQKDPNRFAPQRVEAEDADGNTVILSFPAGQTVTQADVEKVLGPGASILSSSDKKKKVTDWNDSYEKVLTNADKPEIVAARADAYNMEAPGTKVLVPETSHRYVGNVAVPGTEETKYVAKVLPKIGTKQISKKDVAEYAKKRNISYNDALNFILIAGAKSK
jgi:hypothetical protein